LTLSHTGIDSQDLGRWLGLATLKAIGADNNPFTTLDLALIFVRRFLNLRLNVTRFNGCQSAAKLVAGLLEREHVPQMAYDG